MRTCVVSTLVMALVRLMGTPVVAASSRDQVAMVEAVEAFRNAMHEAC